MGCHVTAGHCSVKPQSTVVREMRYKRVGTCMHHRHNRQGRAATAAEAEEASLVPACLLLFSQPLHGRMWSTPLHPHGCYGGRHQLHTTLHSQHTQLARGRDRARCPSRQRSWHATSRAQNVACLWAPSQGCAQCGWEPFTAQQAHLNVQAARPCALAVLAGRSQSRHAASRATSATHASRQGQRLRMRHQ